VKLALASVLGCVVGTVVGFALGAFVGGNFATEFEFAGQRGYEAAGPFGALVGFVVGAVLPWLIRERR
jgi:membrane protein YqaA with SNARE-associated domain